MAPTQRDAVEQIARRRPDDPADPTGGGHGSGEAHDPSAQLPPPPGRGPGGGRPDPSPPSGPYPPPTPDYYPYPLSSYPPWEEHEIDLREVWRVLVGDERMILATTVRPVRWPVHSEEGVSRAHETSAASVSASLLATLVTVRIPKTATARIERPKDQVQRRGCRPMWPAW
jgi:hypothetical protein